jgi:hypothetical protein
VRADTTFATWLNLASTPEKDAAVDKRQASIEVDAQKKTSVPSSPQKELHSTKKLGSPRRVRLARSMSTPPRKLVMMRLQTIEFADGRRSTRLVPYGREAEDHFAEW